MNRDNQQPMCENMKIKTIHDIETNEELHYLVSDTGIV